MLDGGGKWGSEEGRTASPSLRAICHSEKIPTGKLCVSAGMERNKRINRCPSSVGIVAVVVIV